MINRRPHVRPVLVCLKAFCSAILLCLFGACGSSVTDVPNRLTTDAGSDGPAPIQGEPAGRVSIKLPQSDVFIVQGTTVDVPVTVERVDGYSGPVLLRFGPVPDKITASSVTIPSGQTAGTLAVQVAADHTQGKVDPISVKASRDAADSTRGEASLNLFVRGPSGAVDTTFGVGGVTSGTLAAPAKFTHAAVQADGKIVAVGADTVIKAVRFTADGQLDTTFGAGGVAATTMAVIDGCFPRVAIDSMGRVLVSGTDLTVNPMRAAVTRFTPSGQPDLAWGAGGLASVPDPGVGATSEGFDLGFGPLGTVLLVTSTPNESLRILRLSSSGALDTNYNSPLGYRTLRAPADGSPYFSVGGRLDVGADGTALVAYSASPDGSAYEPMLSAVPADGNTRTSTALGAGATTSTGYDVLVARATDGRATMAFPGTNGKAQLRRFAPDLSQDLTFGGAGSVEAFAGSATSLQILADGRILLAGTATPAIQIALQRFNGDGTPDTKFGPGGLTVVSVAATQPVVRGAFLQRDGRLLVVGNSGSPGASMILRVWL